MPTDERGNRIKLDAYPYLECREGHVHPFRRVGSYKYAENGERWTVELRECVACPCVRLDFLDAKREKVRMVYERPDGYLFVYESDERKLERADYARALLKGETQYDTRSALEKAGKARGTPKRRGPVQP